MIQKMIEIVKEWFGKYSESALQNPSECVSQTPASFQEGKSGKRKSTLLDDLETYLFARYDFRFNVLTEQTEYRLKGEGEYAQVDQRVLNTLCIDARSRRGRKNAYSYRDFLPFAEEIPGGFPREQCQPNGEAPDLVGSGENPFEIRQCLQGGAGGGSSIRRVAGLLPPVVR